MASRALRSKSLCMPLVQNPFKVDLKIPWYRKIQMALATVSLLPLRLLLMMLCLFLAWLTASIVLIGTSKEELAAKPLTGWRRIGKLVLRFLSRATLASCGLYWRKTGVPAADRSEIASIPVAPHSTFIDAMVIILTDELPYPVSKIDVADIPIIGKFCRLCQPVFVYREDKDSRHKSIAELKARAKSGDLWPPLLLFPEGTTTNRKALISFKAGAFIPGMPVQPVVIRYPDDWDTVTWAWDGPGAPLLLWMTMCKLWITLEIEYLPVYTPNEQEKTDAYLYADNVRKVMATALQLPTTDHTFEDCRLMEYAKKANLKVGDVLVEFRKMQRTLGLDYERIRELLGKFKDMSTLNDNGGRVDLETFSKYMGLPISKTLRELFTLYDRDGSGHLDFREYVIGMSLISEPASADEPIRLAFQLFDTNSKGYVTRDEFAELLLDMLHAERNDADKLFDKMDAAGNGQITFDDFKAYAVHMPEYAALFETYQRLKETETVSTMDSGVDLGPDTQPSGADKFREPGQSETHRSRSPSPSAKKTQ